MPIICSRREIASRGLLAWMVAIEPSWPVFIACSMSKASSPRHSPRMMRSGRMRSAFLTSSRWRISPLPSTLGGRVSMRATCGCCSCNSAASSMVISRSLSEMKADSAFSIVVLPEPVPPEMIMVMRAFTAAASSSAICGRSASISTSLFRLNGFLENLRIETSGPSTPTGRTATLTREPSSRRASQSGCISSTRRPTADTILLMMRSRCGSSLKRQATGSSRPPRST